MKALKEWIDRRAIAVATKALPSPRSNLGRDERAMRFLEDPQLLRPVLSAPDLHFDGSENFYFRSSVETGDGPNDLVRGKYFERAQGAPTVILVHGWNAELHYLYGLPRLARSLNERNLNALIFELPYHLSRRPKRPAPMRDFISDDLGGMLLATRQALSDIEALARAARRGGSPRVALWGFSLGAWLAGLHITQSDSCTAAVLTTPVSDLKLAIETLSFCFPVRAALEHTPAPVERLNLQMHRLRIAPENVLAIEALYDQFVPARTYAELARSWQLPKWEKVSHSHISILLSKQAMAASADWLAQRLLQPPA